MSEIGNKKYASLNSLRIFLDNLIILMDNHNVSDISHNDIRNKIEDISMRLNALADCDDETLDQISEIVQYIKDNRELIEQITTAKVSVSDIIDNLETNIPNKPLSAAQGIILRQMIGSHTHTTSEITNFPNIAAIESLLDTKQNIANVVTNADTRLTLCDNTEYRLTDVSSLTLSYPEGNFEVWIRIQFSLTESINISFPAESKYIGITPTFNNGETWEISIKDGIAICWRIE